MRIAFLTWAIHGGKSKDDKIDSKKIALLLRGGNLPMGCNLLVRLPPIPSWIDDHFASRASEHRLQSVQDVSTEDAFVANEVRLQSARILLSVQVDPDTKVKRWRRTARDASHPARQS